MVNCPSCGRPLGVFRLNRREACRICARAMCTRYLEWDAAEGLGTKSMSMDGMRRSVLCSTDCASSLYREYVATLAS